MMHRPYLYLEITGYPLHTRFFRVASIGKLSHFIPEISSFPLGANEKNIERLSEALNVRFTNCFFSNEAITLLKRYFKVYYGTLYVLYLAELIH